MKESEYIDIITDLTRFIGMVGEEYMDQIKDAPRESYEKAKEITVKNLEARNKAGTRIDYQAWLYYWNKNCGGLPQVRSLTKKRKAAIKKLCDEVGHDEAWDAYQQAVDYVAQDPWWGGENPGKKMYGFDNLVVHQKVMQKAEAADAEEGAVTTHDPESIPEGTDVTVMGWLGGVVEDSRVAVTGEQEYRVLVEGQEASWFPARDIELK